MSARRNYGLLLGSQVLAAFADNAILAVILGQLTFRAHAGLITRTQLGMANAVYASLFFVPYVLLAPVAGYVNDRLPKTTCLVVANLIKLAGTGLAILSIEHGPFWQGLGYFLVGVGASIFSPAKYGVLPEILPRTRLVKANGTMEFLSLIAILGGYFGGAAMIDGLPVRGCYALLLLAYGLSALLNLRMVATPSHPDVQLRTTVDEFFANFGALLANPRLFRVLCGSCMFWICGAILKMNFQPWGLEVLKLATNKQIALLGVWLSLGIMIGSVLAGQLHQVGDLRMTRHYGWLLASWVGALGLVELLQGAEYLRSHRPVLAMLVLAGTTAGLFLIPLNAALQSECHQEKLGKTIATQNFIDNLGMVAAGSLVFLGVKGGLSTSGVFLCLSVFVALVVTILAIPPKRSVTLSEL